MHNKQDRQYYIDWLRAGAMFLLVFFHSGRLFNEDPWHLKNAIESEGIHIFIRVLDVWQMPVFFLLAGTAAWFSLGRRSAWQFTRERLSRILVPLIFGMLIIVPPQVYLERIFDGDFVGSFFAWYPHTFEGTYSNESAASRNLSWHHLWFLAYLFVFSLLLLPLFRYLDSLVKIFLIKIQGLRASEFVLFLRRRSFGPKLKSLLFCRTCSSLFLQGKEIRIHE